VIYWSSRRSECKVLSQLGSSRFFLDIKILNYHRNKTLLLLFLFLPLQNINTILTYMNNMRDVIQLSYLVLALSFDTTCRWCYNSNFGKRISPITGYDQFHKGYRHHGWKGAPVFATAHGVIDFAGASGGPYGNLIVYNTDFGLKTRYAHLNAFIVKRGQHIRRGITLAMWDDRACYWSSLCTMKYSCRSFFGSYTFYEQDPVPPINQLLTNGTVTSYGCWE